MGHGQSHPTGKFTRWDFCFADAIYRSSAVIQRAGMNRAFACAPAALRAAITFSISWSVMARLPTIAQIPMVLLRGASDASKSSTRFRRYISIPKFHDANKQAIWRCSARVDQFRNPNVMLFTGLPLNHEHGARITAGFQSRQSRCKAHRFIRLLGTPVLMCRASPPYLEAHSSIDRQA